MSGFGQRFPGGLRRGRGRRTSTPVPPEAQHYELDQMANIEASGYTDGDPLEFEEFTGGSQWEEDIEEPQMMEALIGEQAPLQAAEPATGKGKGKPGQGDFRSLIFWTNEQAEIMFWDQLIVFFFYMCHRKHNLLDKRTSRDHVLGTSGRLLPCVQRSMIL